MSLLDDKGKRGEFAAACAVASLALYEAGNHANSKPFQSRAAAASFKAAYEIDQIKQRLAEVGHQSSDIPGVDTAYRDAKADIEELIRKYSSSIRAGAYALNALPASKDGYVKDDVVGILNRVATQFKADRVEEGIRDAIKFHRASRTNGEAVSMTR